MLNGYKDGLSIDRLDVNGTANGERLKEIVGETVCKKYFKTYL